MEADVLIFRKDYPPFFTRRFKPYLVRSIRREVIVVNLNRRTGTA